MSSAFVAELARRLQGQGPALAFPLTWVEQRLSDDGQSIERLVHAEGQRQAADQVSLSNSIGSLRLLGALDRARVRRAMSLSTGLAWFRQACRNGFRHCDLYRHAIEAIAGPNPLTDRRRSH